MRIGVVGKGGRYRVVPIVPGLTAWRKPYQALRSSCENDFKTAGIAEHTYLAILGHSLEVSRKHYVSPTDAELDALAGGAA